MSPNSDKYDETYFDHHCGIPYTRENLYPFFAKIANEIKHNINPKTVIDLGCAKGFLVESLRDLSIEAFGIDTSSYALEQISDKIKSHCTNKSILDPPDKKYDLAICIEVVEHLLPSDAKKAIENICKYSNDVIFSSTSTDIEEKTHHNVQPHEYWVELFAENSFIRDLDFDGTFIAPHAVRYRKKNNSITDTIKYFERNIWEKSQQLLKNKQNISSLESENDRLKLDPMNALKRIYDNRPDLQKTFPEVRNDSFENLLNWAANTDISKIGSSDEQLIINTHRKFYQEKLDQISQKNYLNQLESEKQQNQLALSKLESEKQQNQLALSKLESEKQQNQLALSKLESEKQQNQLALSKLESEKQQNQLALSKLESEKQQNQLALSKLESEKQEQEITISNLVKENNESNTNLNTTHNIIQQQQKELQNTNTELNAIKNSYSWQLSLKFQKVINKIFPSDTSRGNFRFLLGYYLQLCGNYGFWHSTKLALGSIKHQNYRMLLNKDEGVIPIKSWKDLQNFNEIEIKNIKQIISEFKIKPKISIILPVYNVDEKWLRLAIESVRNQIYENWELCIVDDASTTSYILPILSEYEKKDSRIKVKFLQKNKNIAGASNEALSLVSGDYIGLLDHDDEIYTDALFEIAKSINQNSSVQIIYSDENHISISGERIDPFFKPDYSPDLLMTCHYMVHFIVYSTSLLKKLNGFRSGFDGAQDYDLVLRAVEQTNEIKHIPKLLYGWRNIPSSTASGGDAKPYAQIAAKKALEDALKRRKISGSPEFIPELGYFKINYNLDERPLVSIIITTRDRPDLLSRLLSSIEKKTTYDNYEIIIVDHLGEKKETKEFLKSLKHKVIRYEKEFNISNLFNFAEKHSNGKYLLTMNDDLEVISKDWIESMLGPCQRDEVAIVGAQLIYPDASAKKGQITAQTIQHAGVILGVGGIAGHAFRHVPYVHNGYFALNKTLRNYSAVTGACMLVKRDVYKKVNGYDPLLTVAYNDIDFCLRVRNEGYLIVYTPYAKLYHYEGASRGLNQPSGNTQVFVERWKNELLKRDPFYNPNLTLLREDFKLSFFGSPIKETPLALLLEIFATRIDLQKSFPEVSTGNYENLIRWATKYGISGPKYGITIDPSAHILSSYKFWYEEHSRVENDGNKQNIV